MKDSFCKIHPIAGLLYFAAVISFSMFMMNPVCLIVSLLCALTNAIQLNGRKTVFFALKFILPTALLLALINPIVNHAGVTILGYLPWDNPLTLEAIIYGAASAVMLSSVIFWFLQSSSARSEQLRSCWEKRKTALLKRQKPL